jgi:hypothetical protein
MGKYATLKMKKEKGPVLTRTGPFPFRRYYVAGTQKLRIEANL